MAFYITSIAFVITDDVSRVKSSAASLRHDLDDAPVALPQFALALLRGNARTGPRVRLPFKVLPARIFIGSPSELHP
jgi:hypothetical protein